MKSILPILLISLLGISLYAEEIYLEDIEYDVKKYRYPIRCLKNHSLQFCNFAMSIIDRKMLVEKMKDKDLLEYFIGIEQNVVCPHYRALSAKDRYLIHTITSKVKPNSKETKDSSEKFSFLLDTKGVSSKEAYDVICYSSYSKIGE